MMKHNSSFLVLMLGIFIALYSALLPAANPEQIYQDGKNAYNAGDYLKAVKLLFTYRQLVENNIDQSLRDTLDQAILYCDEEILLAIRTKKELDEHGQVIEVVIDASGAADSPTPITKTEKFNAPAGHNQTKPGLPSNVPATPQGAIVGGHVVGHLQPGVLIAPTLQTRLTGYLSNHDWQKASETTWKILVAVGDKNNDGFLNYAENDSFPCNDLRFITDSWYRHYGKRAGYGDILLPRFDNRFTSCAIPRDH